MILGKHYFLNYVVDITADTNLEDIEYIIKDHPEFKKTIGLDNSSESNKSENTSKPKQRKSTK